MVAKNRKGANIIGEQHQNVLQKGQLVINGHHCRKLSFVLSSFVLFSFVLSGKRRQNTVAEGRNLGDRNHYAVFLPKDRNCIYIENQ